MRLLFVTNLYPPHALGGYEIGCAECAEALRARGHEITILTSNYRRPDASDNTEKGVLRILHTSLGRDYAAMGTRSAHLAMASSDWRNQLALRRTLRQVRPEAVLLWNLGHVSYSLISVVAASGIPCGILIFDYSYLNFDGDPWASFWRTRWSPRKEGAKRLLGEAWKLLGLSKAPDRIHIPLALFPSRHLARTYAGQKEKFVAVRSVEVPWGIPVEQFPFKERTSPARRFLYVGQIARHKGVHTVMESFKLLQARPEGAALELHLYGDLHPESDYGRELLAAQQSLPAPDQIVFHGFRKREELPAVYASHDVLLFPSVWEEPLGLVQLEAMASGLPVVSSATGGAGEPLQKGRTGFCFRADDPRSCAEAIRNVIDDPLEALRRARRARGFVEQHHNLSLMASAMETPLMELCENHVH